MDKIPFEDGTLVKAGYVEIDGTKYETVQPEYTGKTPLSAYNLIKMQDNVENAINDGDLVRKIKISGASKQETREGYNLLDFSNYIENNIVGVTVTQKQDGSVVLNGTAGTYGADIRVIYETPIIISKGTYTFDYGVNGANIFNNELNISSLGQGTYKLIKRIAESFSKTTIIFEEDFELYNYNIHLAPNTIFTNFTIKPMIYEGTGDKPYEQYGASPSIEHEAPIESVGDNINEFNKDDTSKILSSGVDGNTLKITSNESQRIFYIECEPNTNYTISKLASTRLQFWDSIEKPAVGVTLNSVLNTDYNFTGTKKTVKTSTNAKYLVCYYYYSSTDTLSEEEIRNSIKICKGTSTGAYSPYGQGSIEIYNCNKNWFNKEAITESYYLNQGNGVLGSSTSSNVSDYIPVRANETYIVTYDYETLVASGKRGYCYFDKNKTYLKGSEYTSSNKTFTLTPTEDGYIRFAYDKNCTNIMVRKRETSTEYVEHQSQTKALYTQQPFRAIGDVKDRFVKQNGVGYEEHPIKRYVFNGKENWVKSSNASPTFAIASFDNHISASGGFSNYFPVVDTVWGKDIVGLELYENRNIRICLSSDSEITTLEQWKAKLSELYNAGTPLYVDYVLATPTLIPCTSEQVEVLNDIYSAYGEGMTNIICDDEIEPVIEIVKETKETVQSENDKAISALLARVTELETIVATLQTATAEEGA